MGFEIQGDCYPCRPLATHLCQSCAFLVTGVGVLYGIIQCCAIKVGEEFLAADAEARARGIPCTCIDIDLNSLWDRLISKSCPGPKNICKAIRAWISFPRVAFHVLFPPMDERVVDVIGVTFLHFISFKWRTWLAFFVAVFAASFVLSSVLRMFSYGAARGVVHAGLVKKKHSVLVENLIILAIEVYMYPRLYEAVAASRDEAMYKGIVKKSQQHSAKRMVVVAGAGHANGFCPGYESVVSEQPLEHI